MSLAVGLSGAWSAEDGLESWLSSVSIRFIRRRDEDSWTLALTLPRLLIGSKDITRGFGGGTWPTSIES